MENKYCIGCGILLQDKNENDDGYIPSIHFNDENAICKRCYQLKHYGKFVENSKPIDSIKLILDNAKNDDLIVLILDSLLINTPIINSLKKLSKFKKILILANRYDLYKDIISKEKIYDFLDRNLITSKLNIIDIILIDNNFDYIFEKISNYSIEVDVYIVGLENAGKSTFINNILKSITNENNNFITKSKYPGTTRDLIKIPLDENNFFVDTPGIYSKGNIIHFIPLNLVKLLNSDNKFCSLTFQLFNKQSITISNFIKIDFLIDKKTNVNLYFPSILPFNRYSYDKSINSINNELKYMHIKDENIVDVKTLTSYEFDIKNNFEDIIIEGIGFIRLNNAKIIINTYKGVNVFKRKSII